MSCTNCYNGCVEIVSDKCVRYTGEPSVALGIETGDTLLSVEQTLIDKVVSFLDGTGIKITVSPEAYCELVTQYLPPCYPECGDPSAVDLFTALVKAACDLQVQVAAVAADIAEINSSYTTDCLEGVDGSSKTHDIVQAVITKLCTLEVDLAALALDVDTNYVKLADLNTLIQAYLDSITPSTQYNTRMVPYTAVEYYGTLANFDSTGAGLSANGYSKIYLCNGLNGTPDKRGRVAVGAIVGVPGGALDSAVNPAYTGNPNYALLDGGGANTVTLTTAQIPVHSHANSLTDNGHSHFLYSDDTGVDTTIDTTHYAARQHAWGDTLSYKAANGITAAATLGLSENKQTGITISNANTGSGGSHANIQPVKACYYIMYIP
jgi:hypothetical protein